MCRTNFDRGGENIKCPELIWKGYSAFLIKFYSFHWPWPDCNKNEGTSFILAGIEVGSILFDVRLGKDGQVSEANKSSIPVKTDKLNHSSTDAIV